MLQWIGDNLSTILICIFLLAIVILIIRSLLRQKKQKLQLRLNQQTEILSDRNEIKNHR